MGGDEGEAGRRGAADEHHTPFLPVHPRRERGWARTPRRVVYRLLLRLLSRRRVRVGMCIFGRYDRPEPPPRALVARLRLHPVRAEHGLDARACRLAQEPYDLASAPSPALLPPNRSVVSVAIALGGSGSWGREHGLAVDALRAGAGVCEGTVGVELVVDERAPFRVCMVRVDAFYGIF